MYGILGFEQDGEMDVMGVEVVRTRDGDATVRHFNPGDRIDPPEDDRDETAVGLVYTGDLYGGDSVDVYEVWLDTATDEWWTIEGGEIAADTLHL